MPPRPPELPPAAIFMSEMRRTQFLCIDATVSDENFNEFYADSFGRRCQGKNAKVPMRK
jgi:hypothetical protein